MCASHVCIVCGSALENGCSITLSYTAMGVIAGSKFMLHCENYQRYTKRVRTAGQTAAVLPAIDAKVLPSLWSECKKIA